MHTRVSAFIRNGKSATLASSKRIKAFSTRRAQLSIPLNQFAIEVDNSFLVFKSKYKLAMTAFDIDELLMYFWKNIDGCITIFEEAECFSRLNDRQKVLLESFLNIEVTNYVSTGKSFKIIFNGREYTSGGKSMYICKDGNCTASIHISVFKGKIWGHLNGCHNHEAILLFKG